MYKKVLEQSEVIKEACKKSKLGIEACSLFLGIFSGLAQRGVLDFF